MVKVTPMKNYPNVYTDKYSRSKTIFTKSLVPKVAVYGERLFKQEGNEYRAWDPRKSKLGAAIVNGIKFLGFKEKDVVLYLGASTGTTVSHVADIVGKDGFVFASDISPQTTRNLIFMAEKRKNVAPFLGDANQPMTYVHKVPQVDFVFQDVAQKNQVEIFLKNIDHFLRKGAYAMLALKCRSIDVAKNPKKIMHEVLDELKKHVEVVDFKSIEPYEKDHFLYLIRKHK